MVNSLLMLVVFANIHNNSFIRPLRHFRDVAMRKVLIICYMIRLARPMIVTHLLTSTLEGAADGIPSKLLVVPLPLRLTCCIWELSI